MVQLAILTMRAFDEAVARDQGNSYRAWLGKVLPHIGDAYRRDDTLFRSHMGASGIGKECARAIWYDFRWATRPWFSGQLLRLFNRGHLEEGRVIALLLTCGFRVYQQDAEGKQYRISSYGGHFGGSGDGVVIGIPDIPLDAPALLEFKTHNDNSFKEVKKLGVRGAKLEHFVQIQVYMLKMVLQFALYIAVNKNTDEIYAEIVPLDVPFANQFIERAHKIIPMVEPPDKVSKSPGWKACSWCDHKPVCHLRAAPERNCRTCKFSQPREDGKWWCENGERQMAMLFGPKEGISDPGETFELSKRRQLTGCTMYERHSVFTS